MNTSLPILSKSEIAHFRERGYLVVKQWCTPQELDAIKQVALAQCAPPSAPLELEAELGYPGAPEAGSANGGNTPRRLLRAFGRSKVWDNHAVSPKMRNCLSSLFCSNSIFLSQAHHNCLMTKSPRYSSDTGWHRDSRYWQFAKNELITAWLALGDEFERNGCLRIIPGSHLLIIKPEYFDDKSFLIADQKFSEELIAQQSSVELAEGDLLFFHCDLLHSASRNFTESDKLSLVFTYYSSDNEPVANTRSSSIESIPLSKNG